MIVDCDLCVVRGDACGDCVITVLLGEPPGGVRLDATEQRALDALAEAGMVPQLRLVPVRGEPVTAPQWEGVAGWVPEGAERSGREVG
jgi:hypothetical protein